VERELVGRDHVIPERARDLVALVLAAGAAVALIVTAVGAAIHRGPISQEESSLLSTALGAAIGAAATYLGIGSHDRAPDLDQPGPSSIEQETPTPTT
jgi:hypothetical protein